jgi:hypothetical protein
MHVPHSRDNSLVEDTVFPPTELTVGPPGEQGAPGGSPEATGPTEAEPAQSPEAVALAGANSHDIVADESTSAAASVIDGQLRVPMLVGMLMWLVSGF